MIAVGAGFAGLLLLGAGLVLGCDERVRLRPLLGLGLFLAGVGCIWLASGSW